MPVIDCFTKFNRADLAKKVANKIESGVDEYQAAAEVLQDEVLSLNGDLNKIRKKLKIPENKIEKPKVEKPKPSAATAVSKPIQPTTKDQKPAAEKEVTGGVQPSTDSVGGGTTTSTPTVLKGGEIVDFPAKKGAPIRYFYKDGAWHFLDSRGREQKEVEGKQQEITDYFVKVTGDNKTLADKIRTAKIKTDKAFDATLGLPVAVWNAAVEIVATAVETGVAIFDAAKRGLDYIKANHEGDWNEGEYDTRILKELGVKREELYSDLGQQVADIMKDFPDATLEEIMVEVEDALPELVASPEIRKETEARVQAMLTPKAAEQVAKDFPKEEKTAESESEEIRGIKHADTEKDRIESGLPPYDKEGKTDDELEAEANELIDKGWNFEKNIDKVLKDGKILSDAEQVALGKYKLYLRDKATQNPTNENINAYERVLKALEFSGTFAGRALRARQLPVNPEPTFADFLVRQKEESGVDELTPEQIEQNKKEFEALQKAAKEWEAKYRALEAEAIKKAADENLSEKKRSKPKTPRTKENIKKERDEILERIRERLKKAKEGMTVDIDGNQVNVQESNVVPYMKQLMAIAPEIPALVKNYIEEGVLELSEIAKRLKNELQADIPDVTEEDAIALIAGEYKTANKKTRDEIQKSLYELRAEAKAIQELQKLEEGEVPTAPSKKVERNKKIADLRKKIKEHPNNQLPQYKKQVQSQIDKLQRDLDSGNYAAPPKKLSIVLDKEARELKRKLVDLKTEREIRLLRESYEKMGYGKKVGEKLIKIANIPRTLMASVDFSAPLRQAIIATIGNPILAAKAFGSMFKAAFNKGYMDEWFFDLESDPNYELIKETGLSIADPNSPFLRAREEAFMSGYVEKVEDFIGEKVFGNKNFGLVKGSERAYVMYLNKMRVDLFNKYADALKAKGKTYENSEEDYKAIAKYVNNITGRGNMGKLEEAAKYLNVLFFSPRLIASRLSLLNPAYFYNLPTDVKKIYVKDMAAFIATGLTVVGMMYFAFGGDDEEDIWVETDPRSSDFMKIRQGDKRWDVWGGFQQYFRTIAQLITSKKKSTQTGEIVELSEDAPFGETRGKLLTRFVRNKLAPVPAFMLNYFSGRTSVGEKVTLKDQLISNLTPLLWQQVYDVAQAEGAVAAITMGVPSVFGVGTERYGERAIEAPAKIKVGEKEYKVLGKHEEVLTEMVQKESKTIVDKIKATPDYKEATKVQKVEMVAMGKTMARKKAVEEFKSKFYKDYPPESAEEMKERIMKEVNKKISDLQLKQQIQ